jgi:hypothetical protein
MCVFLCLSLSLSVYSKRKQANSMLNTQKSAQETSSQKDKTNEPSAARNAASVGDKKDTELNLDPNVISLGKRDYKSEQIEEEEDEDDDDE